MLCTMKKRSGTSSLFLLVSYFTASSAVDSLRFLLIGDMGGLEVEPYYTYFERCTAEEMGRIADRYSPQFVMELGDNFYFHGVKSVDDFRFNVTFEDVYTAKSLQIPWYIVAGNHDHHGNVTAQILYSQRSKRWNFPSLYYYKEFPIASHNQTMGVIFIDTVQLCGKTDDSVNSQPLGPEDEGVAEKQWHFIEEMLKTSRATYLFTAGHFPVYSTAMHGPTKCLVDRLEPLLNKYRANGHLCGHDHNLQHLRVKQSSGVILDYILSGMANTVDPTNFNRYKVPKGSDLFHYGGLLSKGGFVYAEATIKNMTFTFMNGEGKELYRNIVLPRTVK